MTDRTERGPSLDHESHRGETAHRDGKGRLVPVLIGFDRYHGSVEKTPDALHHVAVGHDDAHHGSVRG
ncbi:MAG: hypothetical protein E6J52_09440 [Chloroflexi bacterium]|nr:MAG: hypothetical protein E6J52_09440 [Chloroflexota bacterium]